MLILETQSHFMNDALERKIEKFSRNNTVGKRNKSNGETLQSNGNKKMKKQSLNKTFTVDRNNFVKGDFLQDESLIRI